MAPQVTATNESLGPQLNLVRLGRSKLQRQKMIQCTKIRGKTMAMVMIVREMMTRSRIVEPLHSGGWYHEKLYREGLFEI